jgi:hypothetical protein
MYGGAGGNGGRCCMKSPRKKMTGNEINGILRGHENRNEELLRTLQTKGVALDKGRSVEHHFWANSQREAARLARKLYERGFLVLAISPVSTEADSKLWDVEAGTKTGVRPPILRFSKWSVRL